jgi:hypothetical protein
VSITLITLIISILLGVTGSNALLGVNLHDQSLFSQISYVNSLSEINPLESLSKVTAPLDSLLGGLGRYIDIKPWLPKSALDSVLGFESTLDTVDNISIGQALRIAKSGFILVANILVTILEIVLSLLRSVLGLIR